MSIFGEFCMSGKLSLSLSLTHARIHWSGRTWARSNTLHNKRANKQTNTRRAASERMNEQVYAWMEEERNEANTGDDDDDDGYGSSSNNDSSIKGYGILWKCSVTYAAISVPREWEQNNKKNTKEEEGEQKCYRFMNEKQLDVQVCVNVRIIWGGIYMRFKRKPVNRWEGRQEMQEQSEELSSSRRSKLGAQEWHGVWNRGWHPVRACALCMEEEERKRMTHIIIGFGPNSPTQGVASEINTNSLAQSCIYYMPFHHLLLFLWLDLTGFVLVLPVCYGATQQASVCDSSDTNEKLQDFVCCHWCRWCGCCCGGCWICTS